MGQLESQRSGPKWRTGRGRKQESDNMEMKTDIEETEVVVCGRVATSPTKTKKSKLVVHVGSLGGAKPSLRQLYADCVLDGQRHRMLLETGC
jgi:hypothetical protein